MGYLITNFSFAMCDVHNDNFVRDGFPSIKFVWIMWLPFSVCHWVWNRQKIPMYYSVTATSFVWNNFLSIRLSIICLPEDRYLIFITFILRLSGKMLFKQTYPFCYHANDGDIESNVIGTDFVNICLIQLYRRFERRFFFTRKDDARNE